MIFFLSANIQRAMKKRATMNQKESIIRFPLEENSDINELENKRKKPKPKPRYKSNLTVDEILEDLINENLNKEENKDYRREVIISKLPEFKYKYVNKHMDKIEKTCTICLNDFNPMERVKMFSCGEHLFHKDCIMKWLEKNDYCPLCKTPIQY